MLVVILIVVVFIPCTANAEITSSYSNNTHINPTAFTLTIYSPDNQTYRSIMPLNFTVNWTQYPTFTFPIPPAPKLKALYSYAIDDNPAVFVISNQSSSDVLGYSNFTVNPTFSYSVNVSTLANGYHNIVITASLYGDENLFFSATSSPVQFLVQNPTPSRTSSHSIGALISPSTIPIIAIVAVLVLVVFVTLLYRKHRKTSNLKQ